MEAADLDLSQFVDQGEVSAEQYAAFSKEFLEGLAAIQRRGFVHGDLKQNNVRGAGFIA